MQGPRSNNGPSERFGDSCFQQHINVVSRSMRERNGTGSCQNVDVDLNAEHDDPFQSMRQARTTYVSLPPCCRVAQLRPAGIETYRSPKSPLATHSAGK